ncbi:MAG: rhodanese-related sulfurtransferase [Bacteroidetes bacterium]|nr:rhodanese-related sulfurtransferase [Bacteroidota bacterium]HET6245451.1 rhodanese-related sulfurtransferase [Bacteroidia bacterium]
MALYNRVNKKELKLKLRVEEFKRITLSFYRYVIIENPEELRNQLFEKWASLNVFGRIYLANEGINAQLSVPEENWKVFQEQLFAYEEFENMPFKIAIEDDGKSFYKLAVKVRHKIVADGLDDNAFDVTNVGNHLTAKQFNDALEDPNSIVVDMRNHYESEIGRFEKAICPDVDTFREELPVVLDLLKDKKENKLLLYCTGGIRCEKASAFFKHHGFNDVNQLHGGIIEYARQVKHQGLDSKFKGKNFVFDERLGERISDEIISFCHQCNEPCDTHTNCENDDCHLLFIQCEKCKKQMQGCCTAACIGIAALPDSEQRKIRKGRKKEDCLAVYKSRLRPSIKNTNT